MKAMLRRQLLVLLLYPAAMAVTAQPDTACRETPTARCVIEQAIVTWQTQQASTATDPSLATQLLFEARQYQIPPPQTLQDAAQKAGLSHALAREESFLEHLRQQDFTQATAAITQLDQPLHDTLQMPAAALLIEALTLALKDQQADNLKKQYYESLLTLDHHTRARRMIAVARLEILGGQPQKGLNTLKHTDIDAFSPTDIYQSRLITEWLGASSQQLFLRPHETPGSCDTPQDIARSLQYLMHDPAYTQLLSSTDITDQLATIEGLLLTAKIYRNGDQCELLEKWLTRQALLRSQSSFNQQDVLNQILLARTLRRYFH